MLTTKQKLEKLQQVIEKISNVNSETVISKTFLLGYIQSWIDELEEDK